MNEILQNLQAIIDPRLPLITNLSNASAVLNKLDNINWCGFYIVKEDALYLGPFQGEVACSVIPFSDGVCGYAYRRGKTTNIPDVNEFRNHIACSAFSKSEIVVPIIVDDIVKALIDIDAPIFNRFDEKDAKLIEDAAEILKVLFE